MKNLKMFEEFFWKKKNKSNKDSIIGKLNKYPEEIEEPEDIEIEEDETEEEMMTFDEMGLTKVEEGLILINDLEKLIRVIEHNNGIYIEHLIDILKDYGYKIKKYDLTIPKGLIVISDLISYLKRKTNNKSQFINNHIIFDYIELFSINI
jgi:hypothetical protein